MKNRENLREPQCGFFAGTGASGQSTLDKTELRIRYQVTMPLLCADIFG